MLQSKVSCHCIIAATTVQIAATVAVTFFDMKLLTFETTSPSAASEIPASNFRAVSAEDKEILKEAIVEYKNSLSSTTHLVLNHVTS